jgi:hypothetical protein
VFCFPFDFVNNEPLEAGREILYENRPQTYALYKNCAEHSHMLTVRNMATLRKFEVKSDTINAVSNLYY